MKEGPQGWEQMMARSLTLWLLDCFLILQLQETQLIEHQLWPSQQVKQQHEQTSKTNSHSKEGMQCNTCHNVTLHVSMGSPADCGSSNGIDICLCCLYWDAEEAMTAAAGLSDLA